MATQLIQPNLNPYIENGGRIIIDWLDWCMGYVNSAYANTQRNGKDLVHVNTAPSAWQGWLTSLYKHQDYNFPTGVWVPAWFSYYGTVNGVYGNWGHVVLVFKGDNGKLTISSSPISHKSSPDTWSSIAQIELNYHCKFVGWSEDVVGTRVVTLGGNMAIVQDQDNWFGRFNRTMALVRGRQASRAELKPFVGQDFLHAVEAIEDNPEADNYYALGQWAKANKATVLKQITDLSTQVATLSTRPTKEDLIAIQEKAAAAQETADKAEAEMEQYKQEYQALKDQQTADITAGDTFLRRVGQFISKYIPGL